MRKPLRDYRDNPDRGRAADLLGAAVVQREFPASIAAVAAEALNDPTVPPLLIELADHITSGDRDRMARAIDVAPVNSARRIARLKSIVRREPHNTVRWVDLAREYLTLGQAQQANDAMRVARFLAPNDRFVLRSSAALLAAQAKHQQALDLLSAAVDSRTDPWLLAPMIALSDLAGVKPQGVRDGLRLLEGGTVPRIHTAELAAAVGTVEFAAGADRRARQLFRASLSAPNENAIAQAVWLSDETRAQLLDDVPTAVPRTYEATARHAAQELLWGDATYAADVWLQDQPFSIAAAMFGSWTACEAHDWDVAQRFATAGLIVDPDDPGLLNNLAYAHAQAGNLPAAVEALRRARQVTAKARDRACLAATEGLVLFRAGLNDLGRRRYETAISAFSRSQSRDMAARAAIMIAQEEAEVGTEQAPEALRRARQLLKGVTDPAVLQHAARLEGAGARTEPAVLGPGGASVVAVIATSTAHDLD